MDSVQRGPELTCSLPSAFNRVACYHYRKTAASRVGLRSALSLEKVLSYCTDGELRICQSVD